MEIHQVNQLEVLAILYAAIKWYRIPFVVGVFIHVLVFTILIQVLQFLLEPQYDYYGHVAFYFTLAVIGSLMAIVFTSFKFNQARILTLALCAQAITSLMIGFSGVDVELFTFPNFDFIYGIANFVNANVITLEVLLTYHYLGSRQKRYN